MEQRRRAWWEIPQQAKSTATWLGCRLITSFISEEKRRVGSGKRRWAPGTGRKRGLEERKLDLWRFGSLFQFYRPTGAWRAKKFHQIHEKSWDNIRFTGCPHLSNNAFVWIQYDRQLQPSGFSGIRNITQVSGLIKCSQSWICRTWMCRGWADVEAVLHPEPEMFELFLTGRPFHSYSRLTPESGDGCLLSSSGTQVLSESSLALRMRNVTELQFLVFFFWQKKFNRTQQQPTFRPTSGAPPPPPPLWSFPI